MPRAADAKEEARQDLAVTLDSLEESILDPGKPLMEGVRVVYLGGSRNESIAMAGKILEESTESLTERDPATGRPKLDKKKEVSDEGTTSYDFATHDSFGRLIESHLLGDEYGAELKGRRWTIVEHPAHIHAFFRRKGPDGRTPAFRVLLSTEQKFVMQDYIARVEAKRGEVEQLFKQAGGVVRGGSQAP